MPYTITEADLKASGACSKQRDKALASIKAWPATADDAFAAGMSVDDVLWIAFTVAHKRKDDELRRRLRHCLADIAERVLPIYERHAPGDARVRDCIAAVRRFAQGEIGREELAAARAAASDAAWGARAAASDAAWGARAAASDAAWAAASDAARGARAAARGAAWAAARAAASDAEVEAQKAIICRWLSGAPPIAARKIAEAA